MSIVPPCPAGTCRSSVTTDGRYGWALSPFPQIRLSLCQMSRRQIWCCEQIAIIFISFFFPHKIASDQVYSKSERIISRPLGFS